ncbi:MAG: hypothetical protein ABID38_07315 [Candidatus Diapherotrites archaeon]
MISINTSFHPFRMKLSRREPVQFTVELTNKGDETRKISMDVILSRELSLDKGGLLYNTSKRIDSLAPGKTQEFFFDIFPKHITRSGDHGILIKVLEHYQEYKYVEKEYKKRLELQIED